MRNAYLAISYSNRKLFDKEVQSLIEICKTNDIKLLSFVDKYNFKENEEIEMMKTAFVEIDNSDFLIAELTTKSIGVGIEIGYAKAKGKPIIYLRKKGSEYSTTASGSSTYNIEYENGTHLKELMKKILKLLKKLPVIQ
ncbi:nucleoside 2-deoxyribosyltransferase [Lutibacter aestuarii]|uniref:Nucleoside 2-deoxyribosyltransferase n=1 Tax=Lutibacter aestuarii TaxID=861111 RepID=A0ABW2Z6R4_9FLAO|nr:nucleoside 2-deoxyribosyltransferase [uncultured Lutibacter sp.]